MRAPACRPRAVPCPGRASSSAGRSTSTTSRPSSRPSSRRRASRQQLLGFRTNVARAAARDERADRRAQPVPLPRSDRSRIAQIALLETFADQAVIAIENARLFQELEAHGELSRSVEELHGARRGRPGGLVVPRPPAGARRRSSPTRSRLSRPTAARSTSSTRPATSSSCAPPTGCPLSWSPRSSSACPAGRADRDRSGSAAQARPFRSPTSRRARRAASVETLRLHGLRDAAVPLMREERSWAARDPPQGARRVPRAGRRPAPDVRQPVGAGDRERPPVRAGRGEEPRAGGRQPAQVAVPGEHEPRAAHAAERDHRLLRDAPGGGRGPRRGGVPAGHPGSTRPASTCWG